MTELTDHVVREWQSFAQTKVFAFRGISPAAYELWAPGYFRAILDRSQLHVRYNATDTGLRNVLVTERIPGTWAWTDTQTHVRYSAYRHNLRSVLVTERIPGTESTIVHWAWTDRASRNTGVQRDAWAEAGLDPYKSKIFISHLTVLSEQLCARYGWLFSPFALYKGYKDEQHPLQKTEA